MNISFIQTAYAANTLKVNNGATSIEGLVANIIVNVLLPVAGVVAVGAIVWGGVTYITSQGEPDKLDKAKKTLLYAIVGLLIVVFAYYIVVQFSGLFEKIKFNS
jgi:fructose-specific phosphotransferase system IIC component